MLQTFLQKGSFNLHEKALIMGKSPALEVISFLLDLHGLYNSSPSLFYLHNLIRREELEHCQYELVAISGDGCWGGHLLEY